MRRLLPLALLLSAALLGRAAPVLANGIASAVVDRSGNVYFSDYIHNRVWKVEPNGKMTAWVRGKHSHHLVLDENGTLYGENIPPGGRLPEVWEMTPEGALTDVFRAQRKGHTATYRGTVFATDARGSLLYLRDCQIVSLTVDGRLEPRAGKRCADVWASDALRYGHLHGSLAWGPAGALYFSDGRSVRRVGPDGSMTTLSGKSVTLFADPQPGERRFNRAMGIAIDEAGNVFVADSRDRGVYRMAPDGKETLVARLPFFWSPTGLGRSASGDLYVVANLRLPTPGFLSGVVGNPSLFKITSDGKVTSVATARGKR